MTTFKYIGIKVGIRNAFEILPRFESFGTWCFWIDWLWFEIEFEINEE